MVKLTPVTIIITLLVITLFIGTIIFITKQFASTCPSGQIYDKSLKKCRVQCNADETYYPDQDECLKCPPGQQSSSIGCLKACKNGQERCGTVCYYPSQFSCKNNVLCEPSSVCGDICCSSSQKCDSTTQKCVDCSGKLCNGKCCPKDKPLCVNGVCCTSDRKCKDQNNNDICCSEECCNGVCCSESGLDCNPDTKQCGKKCGKDYCKSGYECRTYTSSSGTSNEYCGPVACSTGGDSWGTYTYDPPSIDDVPVCKTNDGKLWSVSDPLAAKGPLTRYSTVKQGEGGPPCAKEDCYQKLMEVGIVDTDWDETTRTCSGSFNCELKLNSKRADGCPFDDASKSSCCFSDTGDFTGQVCPDGKHCVWDEDTGTNICTVGFICDRDNGYLCDAVPEGKSPPNPDSKLYSSKESCKSDNPPGCMGCSVHGTRTTSPGVIPKSGDPWCDCKDGWRGAYCNVPPISNACYGKYPYEYTTDQAQDGSWCSADKTSLKDAKTACTEPNSGDSKSTQIQKCADGFGAAQYTDALGNKFPYYSCQFIDCTWGNRCILAHNPHQC